MKELGDRAAQGRAYGNLGNTHYLLGNFTEATTFHKEVSWAWVLGYATTERPSQSHPSKSLIAGQLECPTDSQAGIVLGPVVPACSPGHSRHPTSTSGREVSVCS